MTSKTYYTKAMKSGIKTRIDAKNIQSLRQILIRNSYPYGERVKVYSDMGMSRLLGEYHQGSYEGLWKTPAGKFYSLFLNGSFRGEY